jgi:hypothetical protein
MSANANSVESHAYPGIALMRMNRPQLFDGRMKIRHLVLIDALASATSIAQAPSGCT